MQQVVRVWIFGRGARAAAAATRSGASVRVLHAGVDQGSRSQRAPGHAAHRTAPRSPDGHAPPGNARARPCPAGRPAPTDLGCRPGYLALRAGPISGGFWVEYCTKVLRLRDNAGPVLVKVPRLPTILSRPPPPSVLTCLSSPMRTSCLASADTNHLPTSPPSFASASTVQIANRRCLQQGCKAHSVT